jgi:hypothetical protein
MAIDHERAADPDVLPPWIAGRLLSQGRWLRIVFVWCVGVGALTLLLLGRGGAVGIVATLALWASLMTALATWSSRQQLLWQRLTAPVVVPAASWLIGYSVAVLLGMRLWPGLGWAWLLTAVITVVVPVAAAVLTRWWLARRAGSR